MVKQYIVFTLFLSNLYGMEEKNSARTTQQLFDRHLSLIQAILKGTISACDTHLTFPDTTYNWFYYKLPYHDAIRDIIQIRTFTISKEDKKTDYGPLQQRIKTTLLDIIQQQKIFRMSQEDVIKGTSCKEKLFIIARMHKVLHRMLKWNPQEFAHKKNRFYDETQPNYNAYVEHLYYLIQGIRHEQAKDVQKHAAEIKEHNFFIPINDQIQQMLADPLVLRAIGIDQT